MKKIITALSLLTLAGCAQPPRTLPAPVVPVAPPPPPPHQTDSFAGIEATQLRALAGAPSFARKDGVTEMWRYDRPSCRAFFFITGTPPKVGYVETLPRGKDGAADPACLNLLRARSS